MEILRKVYFGAGTWISIGIFWVLSLAFRLDPGISALLATAYALLYTLVALAARRVTKLDYGVILFFAVGAALTLSGSRLGMLYLFNYFSAFLFLFLFLMAYLPIVFGKEPFTTAFAKRTTPQAFWGSDLFLEINRRMTLVWAGLFAASGLMSLIPGFWTQAVAPAVLLIGVGVPLNLRFPDYYLRKKGLGGFLKDSETAPASMPAGDSAGMEPGAVSERTWEGPDLFPENEDSEVDERRARQAETLGPVKNMVVVLGSPRGAKGFTYHCLAPFLEGVRESGIEPEIVHLHEHKVRGCSGCFSCWTGTPGECIHKDDAAELRRKIASADLVVYAQPLYVFSVPGIVKNLLDRMIPGFQPFLIETPQGVTGHPERDGHGFGRRIVVLSVCGFPEVVHFRPLVFMFRAMAGASGKVLCGELLRPASESLRAGEQLGPIYGEVMESFRRAGREAASRGWVSRASERAVSRPITTNVDGFRVAANEFWKAWAEYERLKQCGTPVPNLDTFLAQSPGMMLAGMASAFDPEKARGFEGIFQFDVTGERGGAYFIEIVNGKCDFHEGEAANPTVVIHTPMDVWLAVASKEVSGQEALLKGMYTVEGDVGALVKLGEIFS